MIRCVLEERRAGRRRAMSAARDGAQAKVPLRCRLIGLSLVSSFVPHWRAVRSTSDRNRGQADSPRNE
jgi:hypothetical protein